LAITMDGFPRGIAEAVAKMAGGPMKLLALQQKFARAIVTGSGGGGKVSVRFTLLGICEGVSVDPSLLQPSQQQQLEGYIKDAVQSAMVLRAQEAAKALAGSGGAAAAAEEGSGSAQLK